MQTAEASQSFGAAAASTTEAAATDIATSAVLGGLDGVTAALSQERLAATVDSATTEPSEPKTPVAAPSLPNSAGEQASPTAAHESIAQTLPSAPIAPSTTSIREPASNSSSESLSLIDTQLPR